MTGTPARESIDKRYGHLVVLGIDHVRKWGGTYMLCQCDCGNRTKVWLKYLRDGSISSCGCHNYGPNAGCSKLPIYLMWGTIKQRCYNVKSKYYRHYGGRGITVYEPWLEFQVFKKYLDEHLGECPSKCSIDRINNNGNYEPGNVRWATQKEQANNRRSNTHYVYNGTKHTLAEWYDLLHIEGKKSLYKIEVALGVRKPKKSLAQTQIVHNGVSKTVDEWARELGMKTASLARYCLKKGENFAEIYKYYKETLPMEKALAEKKPGTSPEKSEPSTCFCPVPALY